MAVNSYSQIISKARRLGIDGTLDNSGNVIHEEYEQVKNIANKMGLDTDVINLNEIDNELNKLETINNNGVEYLGNPNAINPSFGEKEYNRTKDSNGLADKSYYQKKDEELKNKENELKDEKNKINEEKSNKNNGTNKYSKLDNLKNNANLAKNKYDRMHNKMDNAKSKIYQATHPKEVLKDAAHAKAHQVADNVKNTAKNAASQTAKNVTNVAKKNAKRSISGIATVVLSNPLLLIVIAIIAFFLFLLIIFMGASSNANSYGYFDSACNFNDTLVTVTNCYNDANDKEILASVDIKDFVIGSTYAYTNGSTYSDEAIKAAMIAIKTNALSYGNYNSNTKDIEVKSCDISYCDMINGCEIETGVEDNLMPSNSEIENLEELYDEVSNYLFISTSYNNTISNLQASNVIEFNENVLDSYEKFAQKNNDFKTILTNYYGVSTESEVSKYKETFYIGESRTIDMLNNNLIASNRTVAENLNGYSWLYTTGIDEANQKMNDNKEYNIVIWLGLNDLWAANSYYNLYSDLATNEWTEHNIYVVSTTYVDELVVYDITNSEIDEFNNTLRTLINNSGISNLKFIDINSSNYTYESDGLTYSKSDYNNIYNEINSKLDNYISSDLHLYKLDDYCTFYNIVESDAYWWPIGSENATAGSIYGGSPTVTNITSDFGWRNINGVYSYHQGIDIAGGDPDAVIIATKSGTVINVNDGCEDSLGYKNDTCGGGYGNYVMIEHSDGVVSVYAHMLKNTLTVDVGDKVNQGQNLGTMGNSGSSTGTHLHFELRVNNQRVNPLNYVSASNPRPTNNYNISGVDSSDNKYAVCKTLLNSGFSENATIGLMVNIQAESNFNPNNVGDSGTSYGLCQWHNGRWNSLKSIRPNDWQTIEGQLNFLVHELEGYAELNSYLKNATTESAFLAEEFCLKYERPLNMNVTCKNRVTNYLDTISTYVKNGCN